MTNGSETQTPNQNPPPYTPTPRKSGLWMLGVVLVAIGVLLLTNWQGMGWCGVPFGVAHFALPSVLFALGLGLLIGWLLSRSQRNGATPQATPTTGETNPANPRLLRSRNRKVLAGICGGIGNHLHIDPTIVRILWVIFAFASLGTALLLYVILIFVIPEET